MGPLLFLIYVNSLADDLSSNTKLLANNTSLFWVINDADTSEIKLKQWFASNQKIDFPLENEF